MTTALGVQGIIPGDMFGVNLPSTADLQNMVAQQKEAAARLKEEKAQARQAAKDEKIFNNIRKDLVQKAFHLSEKEIKNIEAQLAIFEADVSRDLSDKDKLNDSINVANGARGTEKASRRNFKWLLFGGASTLAGLGLNYAIGKSVNDVLITAVSGLIKGVLGTSVIGLAVVGVELIVKAIYNWHYKRKADKGNRSDTKEKERNAIIKIKEMLDKLTKFTEEIKKDQQMLVEKKKSMNKKEFDKYLDEYLKSKIDFLKEIGLNDYLRDIADDSGLQVSAEQTISSTAALGANA